MQLQRLPFTVSTIQHRHTPMPHAIRFSSETSQIMLFLACSNLQLPSSLNRVRSSISCHTYFRVKDEWLVT